MAWHSVMTLVAITAVISSLIVFSEPEEAYACGIDPFIAEICWFGGNFAPRGYAFCGGQLLAISSNQALFALLGTTYGGDGETTFGLPDMRGRVPIHGGSGTGPGLSPYQLGAKGGVEQVTLTVNQIPSHNHGVTASTGFGDSNNPDGKILSRTWPRVYDTSLQAGESTSMNSQMIQNTGGNQGHENRQPYLAINCIIALQGIFPS